MTKIVQSMGAAGLVLFGALAIMPGCMADATGPDDEGDATVDLADQADQVGEATEALTSDGRYRHDDDDDDGRRHGRYRDHDRGYYNYGNSWYYRRGYDWYDRYGDNWRYRGRHPGWGHCDDRRCDWEDWRRSCSPWGC